MMIANMQNVSAQLARGDGTMGKLIYDETLYTTAITAVSNLQSATDEIRVTLADARTVVDQVNAGHGTLGRLLKDESLYNETTGAMVSLGQILEKINQGEGSVGKLVNDQEFYRNARMTLQKLDKATEGLEDQGPLSVLGIAVNSLF
jgi:phospholipid/cholesterol/gamma-HCH transport system substrate-binding protein